MTTAECRWEAAQGKPVSGATLLRFPTGLLCSNHKQARNCNHKQAFRRQPRQTMCKPA